jgi:RecA/RadA recombinase
MGSQPAAVDTALATLRERWGAAAPRTIGALATAPVPTELDPIDAEPVPRSDLGPAIPIIGTGFPALDAILGPGGLPRTASLALRGSPSSGRTTLALRLVAEAQAAGCTVAWLDLDRSLDPVEAVARGVSLEWLVVLAPADLEEGLSLAGALLGARAVDLLLVDLPARPERPGRAAERLGRLAALARRAGSLLVVLEPPALDRPDRATDLLGSVVGLRLELARRSWIRLGRDVVGQRIEVAVGRNRFGPPGGRTELRILYAEGGPRDACLREGSLLADGPPSGERASPAARRSLTVLDPPDRMSRPTDDPADATPPPPLAPSAAPTRSDAGLGLRLRVLPERPDRPRRTAVDRPDGHRRGPARSVARRPPRDAARSGSPARP